MNIENNNKMSGLKNKKPWYYFEIIIFMFTIIAITRAISFQTQILFPIITLLLSIPIIIFNLYKISMVKKMSLSKFHTEGKIFRFFSGRIFFYILLIIIAPFISGYTLIKMYGFSFREWIALFIMIPIFIFIFNFLKKHFGKEIKKAYLNIYTVHWALLIIVLLISMIFALIVFFSGEFDLYSFNSLNDAVQAESIKYSTLKSCSIASVIASKIAFLDGFVLLFLSKLTGWLLFLTILITVGEGLVFLYLLSAFSLYLLKSEELSIIYKPMSSSSMQKQNNNKIILTTLLISIGVLFLYTTGYVFLEKELKTNKNLQEILNAPQKIFAEYIDGEYMSSGTIEKLNKIKKEMQIDIEHKIYIEIDEAYDMMINNVDVYLDWYYGITAEYIRLANLLTGQIDTLLKEKLKEHIKTNEIITDALKGISDIAKDSKLKFDKIKDKLKKKNRINYGPFDTVIINKRASLDSMLMVNFKIIDKISIDNRAILSLVGAISGAIIGRIIAKSVIKQSGKIIAKILAKKTVGVLARIGAGALVGGSGGSIVTPGIGTVIGGVAGGILGFFATDVVILSIEEELNRKKHKKKIIEAINESRKEFKKWNF